MLWWGESVWGWPLPLFLRGCRANQRVATFHVESNMSPYPSVPLHPAGTRSTQKTHLLNVCQSTCPMSRCLSRSARLGWSCWAAGASSHKAYSILPVCWWQFWSGWWHQIMWHFKVSCLGCQKKWCWGTLALAEEQRLWQDWWAWSIPRTLCATSRDN